jgi:predicted metal-dependent phosphoesterase TrpH
MHLHTSRSFDSLNDPDAVVRTALARGIDRVCITDHNEIAAALELKDRYPGRVIVGEEVETAEGVDLIGLFLHELIPKGTPAREACSAIRAQGGLVYVPHPFARGKGGGGRILSEIADLVDAVEGFNARIHSPRLNEAAVSWAEARGIAVGAGSDAHTLREVGRAYVELQSFDDEPRAFLAALRQGRIEGRLSSWAVHLGSTYAKIRKRLGK